MNVDVSSENEMMQFGRCLADAMGGRGCVHISGELGAGKTTLCRGMLRAMGHIGAVKSPTFTLVEPYQVPGALVYHFDLYRLSDPNELDYIGIEEYFGEGKLCLIEWPERGQGILPDPDLWKRLSVSGDGRKALVSAATAVGVGLQARLAAIPLSSVRG